MLGKIFTIEISFYCSKTEPNSYLQHQQNSHHRPLAPLITTAHSHHYTHYHSSHHLANAPIHHRLPRIHHHRCSLGCKCTGPGRHATPGVGTPGALCSWPRDASRARVVGAVQGCWGAWEEGGGSNECEWGRFSRRKCF